MARTTDNLRDRGSARPRARSPTNDRARRFPSDRRPIGERTANEQKKKPARSPRLARARLAPGTLARASSRTVEPSIRARAMDAPPRGLDGESRPVVCLLLRARARGKRGDDSVYCVVSKTMKRRAGDGRGRDDVARVGVNRRVMNRRTSDSTTAPACRHPSRGRSVVSPTPLGHRRSTYIYRFKVIDYWFSSRARPKYINESDARNKDGWDGF